MSKQVLVVLVGIGGYGGTYCSLLLNDRQERGRIAGVVDPFAKKSRYYEELKSRGIPFYDRLEDFYRHHSAELAIISTPIHLHCPQTCTALSHGSNVLCEKPLCAHPLEAEAMLAAERASGGQRVAIGYQWSYCTPMWQLKADILAGRFGRPLQFKSMVLWPRGDSYYARNNWAGALLTEGGDWIYDSPANNACAHYLHNMLYLAGEEIEKSGQPTQVQAELYRANPIASFDSAAFRVACQSVPEILFYTTHASSRLLGPVFQYTFEEGSVDFHGQGSDIIATFNNGEQQNYGNPNQDGVEQKLWGTMQAIRTGGSILCGIEASMMQTLCIFTAMQSCPEIQDFPSSLLYKSGIPGNQVRVMAGLSELMEKAYQESALPAEISKAAWIKAGKPLKVETKHKAF